MMTAGGFRCLSYREHFISALFLAFMGVLYQFFRQALVRYCRYVGIMRILDEKIESAAQGYWCKTRERNATIFCVWQVTIT